MWAGRDVPLRLGLMRRVQPAPLSPGRNVDQRRGVPTQLIHSWWIARVAATCSRRPRHIGLSGTLIGAGLHHDHVVELEPLHLLDLGDLDAGREGELLIHDASQARHVAGVASASA